MSVLNFDVQFQDETLTNFAVDNDIYCEVYDSTGTLKDTLTLTSAPTAIQYNTTVRFYFVANLDVSSYSVGNIIVKWYAKKDTVNVQPYPYIETITHPDQSETGMTSYDNLVDRLRLLVLEDSPGDELTEPRARTLIELSIRDLRKMKNIKTLEGVTLVDDLLDPSTDAVNDLEPLILKNAKLLYMSTAHHLTGFTDNGVERRTADLSGQIRDLRKEINEDIKRLKIIETAGNAGVIAEA